MRERSRQLVWEKDPPIWVTTAVSVLAAGCPSILSSLCFPESCRTLSLYLPSMQESRLSVLQGMFCATLTPFRVEGGATVINPGTIFLNNQLASEH